MAKEDVFLPTLRPVSNEVAGRVNVASIYSVGLSHMNRYVQEFLTRHPQANIRLEYHHPKRVYELVDTGGRRVLDPDTGWYHDRPPFALIDALDKAISTRRAA